MKIVLAIDDTPERYFGLSLLLGEGHLVVCLQTVTGAEMVLASGKVCAVFLDHDMPSVKNGAITEEYSGQYFAREVLAQRSIPVAITSANPDGAEKISSILEEYAVPWELLPVTERDHLKKWVNFIARSI